jgi:CheY-like chemotaxis protein
MPPERLPVLLIEDNPADLRLVEELVEEEAPGRFRIESARRLADGLEALRAGAYAAVVLDLSLPDADGIEAIGAVRAVAPSMPVIVLSGLMDEGLRALTARHGAAASFAKGEASIPPLVAAIDEFVRARA